MHPLAVRALLEHRQLDALAGRLARGEEPAGRELCELLEAHVRFEEHELFPLIEHVAGDGPETPAGAPIRGRGPVWGAESEDLNATLLAWGPGDGPAEHVNDERDVLVFVVEGAVTLTVDGEPSELATGSAAIVARGRRRRLTAGPLGVRYLSVHVRRPPLQIQPAAARP